MKKHIVLLVFILVSSWTISVQAQNCDQLVDDQAGLFGDRIFEVDSTAKTLSSVGAEVRVVTLARISTPTLDYVKSDLVRACPSWRRPDGDLKSNLVVFMISMSPTRIGIYAGGAWADPLKSQTSRIQGQMGPLIRSGKATEAFVMGLNETKRLIESTQHPVSGSGPVTVQSKPVDFSGLWKVLALLVSFLILAITAFFLWRLLHFRKEHKEKLMTAKQAALAAKNDATRQRNAFEDPAGPMEVLRADIELIAVQIDPEEARLLRQRFNEINLAAQSVSSEFVSLAGDIDPFVVANPTISGFNDVCRKYEGMSKKFTGIERERVRLNTDVAAIRSEIESAPARLNALQLRLGVIETVIGETKVVFVRLRQTYAPSSWESIHGNGGHAEALVAEAKSLIASLHPEQITRTRAVIGEAELKIDQAEKLLHAISSREEQLIKAQSDAPKEIVRAEQDIAAAHQYIQANKDAGKHNDELAKASGSVREARAELSLAQPDFPRALDRARAAHAAADAALEGARNEVEAQRRLVQKASGQMREAERTILKARNYIESHGHTGKTADGYLDKAAGCLKLAQGTVDLQKQITYAAQAEEWADKAYSKAREKVEQREEKTRSESSRSSSYHSSNNTIVVVNNESHHDSSNYGWGSSSSSSSSDSSSPSFGSDSSWSGDSGSSSGSDSSVSDSGGSFGGDSSF